MYIHVHGEVVLYFSSQVLELRTQMVYENILIDVTQVSLDGVMARLE